MSSEEHPSPSDTLRWAPFSLALHLCSREVITKWGKIYTRLAPDFKNHRNLDNFRQAVESPKSWNSMGYFCLKTTFLHLKHYLQIYLTLLSTDLWFGKWYEKYGKFFPDHSKLGFWWDLLIQTWESMSLKSRGELSVMTMKNTQNLKRNRLVMSKLTWRIWQILPRALESLKNFHFNGFLLGKVCIVWTKKVQRSYFSLNWRRMQNLENNQLAVSKLT